MELGQELSWSQGMVLRVGLEQGSGGGEVREYYLQLVWARKNRRSHLKKWINGSGFGFRVRVTRLEVEGSLCGSALLARNVERGSVDQVIMPTGLNFL